MAVRDAAIPYQGLQGADGLTKFCFTKLLHFASVLYLGADNMEVKQGLVAFYITLTLLCAVSVRPVSVSGFVWFCLFRLFQLSVSMHCSQGKSCRSAQDSCDNSWIGLSVSGT